ncbi:MAG: anaerobic carbon-monoxide dehydrogenase iron sulfur subunit [Thermoproteota archaeon]|nr:anaerobic carbon-monoxide dehydrogenase iron sulfur subunit [Thermoproteota archaeon]
MVRHNFVAVDPDKCVGCRICEFMCSLEKEKCFNPTKSRIRTVRIYPDINASIACRLCEDAPCVIACPRKALEQSAENGTIMVDKDKCNGCGWCIEACDFGALTLDLEKKTVKVCDLCNGSPKCVEWCPEEALELTNKDVLAQKARIDAVKKLFKASLEGKT